jgi:hypothetical protein
LRVPDNLIGSKVRCPQCKTVFTANAVDDNPDAPPAAGSAPPPSRPSAAPRAAAPPGPITERPSQPPQRRPEREPDEEDEPAFEEAPDDDDDRGRRPRRSVSKDRARGMVMAPAIILLVVGGLGLLAAAVNTLLQLVNTAPPGAMGLPGAAPPPGVDQTAYKIGAMVGATIGFPWSLVILLGGIQMLRLRGRAMAIAGSAVAMVPCSPCCILGLPIGIWSLIVLNKEEVIRAFD